MASIAALVVKKSHVDVWGAKTVTAGSNPQLFAAECDVITKNAFFRTFSDYS